MRIKTKIDTASLPLEQAQNIQKWVQDADFFSLPASMPIPSKGADRFQYNLTIEDKGQHHSVELHEADTLPEPLKQLIKLIMEIARNNPAP